MKKSAQIKMAEADTRPRQERERPKDELPKIMVDSKLNVGTWQQFLHGLLKKQIIKVVTGETLEFDNELTRFIMNVWQDGYDKGLSHMDKMHKKIDQELGQ